MTEAELKVLLPELLLKVQKIAQEAGDIILDVYKNGFDINTKADDSPVTTADLAANNFIVSELNKLLPNFYVLSEESEVLPFEERKKLETYWLVDPLDGTKEFINKRDNFTVNIALIHQHKSILGVIYAPVSGDSYYAVKGTGSYKENKAGLVQPIQARKLENKPIFAGSSRHGGGNLRQFLDSAKLHFNDYAVETLGSSLKMCLIAEGKVDLYPRLWYTSEWDTAAAHCIVDEAGGRIVKTDMSPLLYNTKDSLLNPFFFAIGDNSYDWVKHLPEKMIYSK